jgi:hypothetical protein
MYTMAISMAMTISILLSMAISISMAKINGNSKYQKQ